MHRQSHSPIMRLNTDTHTYTHERTTMRVCPYALVCLAGVFQFHEFRWHQTSHCKSKPHSTHTHTPRQKLIFLDSTCAISSCIRMNERMEHTQKNRNRKKKYSQTWNSGKISKTKKGETTKKNKILAHIRSCNLILREYCAFNGTGNDTASAHVLLTFYHWHDSLNLTTTQHSAHSRLLEHYYYYFQLLFSQRISSTWCNWSSHTHTHTHTLRTHFTHLNIWIYSRMLQAHQTPKGNINEKWI